MVKRIAVVTVACVIVVSGLTVWKSSAATGPGVIRVTATQAKYGKLDVGRRGTSPGDMEFVRARIFNRRITRQPIGRYELVCTWSFGNTRTCEGTAFLPLGRLVVSGVITQRDIYQLAIIGGTGLYDNARGTLTVTRTARKPRREFLIFRLVG